MRILLFAVTLSAIVICCRQQQTLQQQLQNDIMHRLHRIDSLATLDSIRILWNIPATQKMGTIIDDTFYLREYARIKTQLAGAQAKKDKDSIEFYQYEINYMQKEIDSISKFIEKADTTHRFASLIGCSYYVTANNKTRMDTMLIFIDSTMTIRFTDYLDSAIKRTIKALK